jgi:hypothetical protein
VEPLLWRGRVFSYFGTGLKSVRQQQMSLILLEAHEADLHNPQASQEIK